MTMHDTAAEGRARRSLVAGGAGFIGSHLTEALVKRGDEVTVVDDLSTGSLDNLSGVIGSVEFVEADIGSFEAGGRFDKVYHLACTANAADYTARPLDVLRSSSSGTANLLGIASESGADFCYFSSSEVYGDQPQGGSGTAESSTASFRPLTARSVYQVSKSFAEELVARSCEASGIWYAILRPFNIYGTRMDVRSPYGRVMTNFARSLSRGEPLTVNGDGLQTRSFCHVDDAVRAVLLLDSLPGYPCAPLNVGNPEQVTIEGLARLMAEACGAEARIVHADPVPDEPRHRMPDVSLARSLLGWSPEIPLREGIRDVLREAE